jgi:hypothetical protein
MGLLERTKVVVCRHAPSPSPQSAPLAALAALFSPKSQRLESHGITAGGLYGNPIPVRSEKAGAGLTESDAAIWMSTVASLGGRSRTRARAIGRRPT